MQEGMLSLMQVKQGMTRTLMGLNIHRCYLFQGGMAFSMWVYETVSESFTLISVFTVHYKKKGITTNA